MLESGLLVCLSDKVRQLCACAMAVSHLLEVWHLEERHEEVRAMREEGRELPETRELREEVRQEAMRDGSCAPSRQSLPGHKPNTKTCIASLLHGDSLMFLVYAIILGRRLQEEADQERAPDRILLCGPGRTTTEANKRALSEAGWTHIIPVEPIEAGHLDKSWSKRHAWVFTKLRVLELPYDRVLLLDLDLYPRTGVDMAELLELPAPAAKYHCATYQGPEIQHGTPIPAALRDPAVHPWCPNAGVRRLDPHPEPDGRKLQIKKIMADISQRNTPTYLPDQYYLV